MSLTVLSSRRLWSRWRTPYRKLPGGVLLNRRAAQPGWKAPGGHMKTRFQPPLPCRPRIGDAGKEPAGHVKEPCARLQPLTTREAAVLVRRDRMGLYPVRQQLRAQALGAFREQGGNGRPLAVSIQSAQGPCTEPTQPTVQGTRMRRGGAQEPDSLPQGGPRSIGGDVRCTRGLDHRPRVALVRRDLNRQDAPTPLADRATTLRYRRLAILDVLTAWPTRASRQPAARPDQRPHSPTPRTWNLPADRFAFDGRGFQGIICDGNGNWDSTLSGFPRGTGA